MLRLSGRWRPVDMPIRYPPARHVLRPALVPASPLRIAHRGMPRLARENTLPSFELAMDAGADGLELDVHTTADGVVVVHHDPDLGGGGRIDAMTLAELRRHEAAPGVPIPTLEELCAL